MPDVQVGDRDQVPSNPTGAVASEQALDELLAWAAGRELVVVSDDCYDEIWLDAPAPCTAAVAERRAARGGAVPPVVSVFSFSKTHSMTGFRLGCVVSTPPLTALVQRVQETVLSCPSTPAQHAGLAAVTGPQDHVAAVRDSYRRCRDTALALFAPRSGAVEVEVAPSGAFYLWLRYRSDRPSAEVARYLLTQHGVALAPGAAFGPRGEGRLRVSLAADVDVVVEGLRRTLTALG